MFCSVSARSGDSYFYLFFLHIPCLQCLSNSPPNLMKAFIPVYMVGMGVYKRTHTHTYPLHVHAHTEVPKYM